jgi:hypothetical protein
VVSWESKRPLTNKRRAHSRVNNVAIRRVLGAFRGRGAGVTGKGSHFVPEMALFPAQVPMRGCPNVHAIGLPMFRKLIIMRIDSRHQADVGMAAAWEITGWGCPEIGRVHSPRPLIGAGAGRHAGRLNRR